MLEDKKHKIKFKLQTFSKKIFFLFKYLTALARVQEQELTG